MCSSESLIPAGRKLTRCDVVVASVVVGLSHGVVSDAATVSGIPVAETVSDVVVRDNVPVPKFAFVCGGGLRFLHPPTWLLFDIENSSPSVSMGPWVLPSIVLLMVRPRPIRARSRCGCARTTIFSAI